MIKRLLFITLLLTGFTWLTAFSPYREAVEKITFSDFEKRSKSDNDTTYVFNFWATWCKPCVAELPYFDKIGEENKKVKVILISLDNALQTPKVDAFVKEKKVKSEVVIMKDTNYNDWIDKVDSTWSGAIPATLIVNNKTGYRKFHEGDLSYEELKSLTINEKTNCDAKN